MCLSDVHWGLGSVSESMSFFEGPDYFIIECMLI